MDEQMNDGVPQYYVDNLIDTIAAFKRQYAINKTEAMMFFSQRGSYGTDDPAEADRRYKAAMKWLMNSEHMEYVETVASQRAGRNVDEALGEARKDLDEFWNWVAKEQGNEGSNNAD